MLGRAGWRSKHQHHLHAQDGCSSIVYPWEGSSPSFVSYTREGNSSLVRKVLRDRGAAPQSCCCVSLAVGAQSAPGFWCLFSFPVSLGRVRMFSTISGKKCLSAGLTG